MITTDANIAIPATLISSSACSALTTKSSVPCVAYPMSFARREMIIKWKREQARRHNNRPPYTSRLYISIATSTRFIEPAATTENQADSPLLLIVVLFKDFVSCPLFYFSNDHWFFFSSLPADIIS